MAVEEIRVPDIGGYRDVSIVEVFVQAGDTVAAEEGLISLESDKAVMEVPSPFSGKIVELIITGDDTVSEGDLIALIEVEGAAEISTEAERQTEEQTPAAETEPAPEMKEEKTAAAVPPASTQLPDTKQPAGGIYHASPSVRQYARELGVPLASVQGSGHKGRITKEDVQNFVKQQLEKTSRGGSGALPEITLEDFSRYGQILEETLGRIPRISGPHLHASWLNIPHVTHFDETDITELEEFRKKLNATKETEGVKYSILPFIIKAVVQALKEFPKVNASLNPDAQTLIKKFYYHIGIAVDTPEGLVVPVIRDADKKTISELGSELSEISQRSREGKLKPADFSGGSFSISSLGGIGGTGFTPIVNGPQAAILGVSRASWKPVWNGNEFAPRLMLPYALSYDHRIIDGAEAARFCRALGTKLEQFHRMITQ